MVWSLSAHLSFTNDDSGTYKLESPSPYTPRNETICELELTRALEKWDELAKGKRPINRNGVLRDKSIQPPIHEMITCRHCRQVRIDADFRFTRCDECGLLCCDECIIPILMRPRQGTSSSSHRGPEWKRAFCCKSHCEFLTTSTGEIEPVSARIDWITRIQKDDKPWPDAWLQPELGPPFTDDQLLRLMCDHMDALTGDNEEEST